MVIALMCALLGAAWGHGEVPGPLPPAAEVTRRLLERSRSLAESEKVPQYTYEKRSVLQQLDAAGKVLSSEEKIHEVKLIHGLPFNRLVKIKGRKLTPEELKQQDAREERFQQKFVTADRRKMVARKQALVTPELLARYEFTVLRRVVLGDRPALELRFKPKAGDLPERSIGDRILNRMTGTLWIDEDDADAVRIEANLADSMGVGLFGLLGSLTRFDLSLTRKRMPDGQWINDRMTIFVQCRKLMTNERFRLTEESSRFRPG